VDGWPEFFNNLLILKDKIDSDVSLPFPYFPIITQTSATLLVV